jgi:hypothetical protein
MKTVRKKSAVILALCSAAALIVGGGAIALAKTAADAETAPIEKNLTVYLIIDGNSNRIKSGDIVSITVSNKNVDANALQYVKVVEICKASADEIYDAEREGACTVKKSSNPIKIQFALCKQQLSDLAGLNVLSAKIKFVCHGNDSRAQELLNRQDKVLRTLAVSKTSGGSQEAYSSTGSGIHYSASPSSSQPYSQPSEDDIKQSEEQQALLKQ